MNITCDLKALLTAVNNLLPAGCKTNFPALNCVSLSFVDGVLTLTANDLSTSVSERLSADGTPGSIGVPYAGLRKALAGCKPGKVTIESKEYTLSIVQGLLRQTLRTMSAVELPRRRDVAGEVCWSNAGDICKLFAPVLHSASNEEGIRGGVSFHTRGSRLRAVSTDGHRLTIAEVRQPAAVENLVPSILQKSGIVILLKVLAGQAGEPVGIYSTPQHTTFVTSRVSVDVEAKDSTPPDYEALIPVDCEGVAVFDSQVLADALRPVVIKGVEAKGLSRSAGIEIGDLGVCVLTNSDPASGIEIQSAAPVLEFTGKDIKANINPQYLLDAIDAIDDKDVKLSWVDGSTPFRIETCGPEAVTCVCIVALSRK